MLPAPNALAGELGPGLRVRIAEQVLDWLCRPDRDGLHADTGRWGEREWAAARFAVQVHGVGPWLHTRLAGGRGGGARAAFLDYVAHCHAMNVQRHAMWRAELEGVLAAAAHRAIPLVPLKGAALLPWVWTDPALRPTSDIDLLARPADRAHLDRLLESLGWTLHGEVPRHRAFFLTRLGLDPRPDVGEHPAQPLKLEVHEHARQAFIGLEHDATDALWRSPSAAPLGGTTLALPPAGAAFEHTLLHTAFDLAKRLTRFIKLEDLRLLAPRLSEEAWTQLVANAHDLRLERFYLAPLLMAERYLGPIASPDVMRTLEAGTPSGLHAWLCRTPISYFTACGSVDAGPQNVWARLRWMPRGRAWLAGARRLVAPTPAERRDEFAVVARDPSLWTYYRAQLTRWR